MDGYGDRAGGDIGTGGRYPGFAGCSQPCLGEDPKGKVEKFNSEHASKAASYY